MRLHSIPPQEPTLAQLRARLAAMRANGTADQPLTETETIGDRMELRIAELEISAGLRDEPSYWPPIDGPTRKIVGLHRENYTPPPVATIFDKYVAPTLCIVALIGLVVLIILCMFGAL